MNGVSSFMDVYLIIVIVLLITALSGLVVGVGNDAVNFLNSAIGSKVAPRYIILSIASLGILFGTFFSNGMMEIARNGIFQPDKFTLPEVMVIFLAFMITNILLLDFFNTFGLPTSTTVSLVFGLLGSAVTVSLIKIIGSEEYLTSIVTYINTAKALAIISGILLSVVIAFTVGAFFQYISRLLFSFNYLKTLKYFGSIWGSFSITCIVYFILIKGSKGTTFLNSETVEYINNNSLEILILSFVFWIILFQLLISFFKINIFKGVVLAGTFALALAFAANDLVNFIGVPIAGYHSYLEGINTTDPTNLYMNALNNPVKAEMLFLIISGIIMVLTLWFNKKARSVTKTEVNLGRQSDGFERFESSKLSRIIVRMSVTLSKSITKRIPENIKDALDRRFNQSEIILENSTDGEKAAFDLIRASNNLVVASMLISLGTSFKLPLSTTYVAFMVAMATSLSDKAWGRESAVYRVNGVLTVIGGWFFTAFCAFLVSSILALIIFYGEIYSVIALTLLAGYILYRTHILHRNRTIEENEEEETHLLNSHITNKKEALSSVNSEIVELLEILPNIFNDILIQFSIENRNSANAVKKITKKLRKRANLISSLILNSLELFKEEEIKANKRFSKIISHLQEICNKLINITSLFVNHLDNNHHPLSEIQIKELKLISDNFSKVVKTASKLISDKKLELIEEYQKELDDFILLCAECETNQLHRIKGDEDSTRNSMLYLNILSDLENVSNHINRLLNTLKNIMKSFPI